MRLAQACAFAGVRKTPNWPRSWANFSLYSCIPTGMHWPTCIFWANLTTFSIWCALALGHAHAPRPCGPPASGPPAGAPTGWSAIECRRPAGPCAPSALSARSGGGCRGTCARAWFSPVLFSGGPTGISWYTYRIGISDMNHDCLGQTNDKCIIKPSNH